MAALVTITQQELHADPDARLWALISHLAGHPEMCAQREIALLWLPYIYDAEVRNGGHLQYFHNQGTAGVPATIDALRVIGAEAQATILSNCFREMGGKSVQRVRSLAEYFHLAAERSFTTLDDSYYGVKPEVMDLLRTNCAELIARHVAVAA